MTAYPMSSAFSNSHSRLAIAEHPLGLNIRLADTAQKLWSNRFEKLSQRIRLYWRRVLIVGLVRLRKSSFLLYLRMESNCYSRITFAETQ